MELSAPGTPGEVRAIRWKDTCRLIPSRFPAHGILDEVASPGDLQHIFELESWSNDRISVELGLLHKLPRDEWVTGPQASVIMAAFCHPRTGGGRFNGAERGAWYAARSLETAHAEVIYHRARELAEIGVFDTRMEMRLYLADFRAPFHDLRAEQQDSESYEASRKLARELLARGSNGILYRSVRQYLDHPGGECIACFRPKLVSRVRASVHFEYRWDRSASSRSTPVIRQLEPTGSAEPSGSTRRTMKVLR